MDPLTETEEPQGDRIVTIAVLTYCRIFELRRCLDSITRHLDRPQVTESKGWRILEVLVVDNDPGGSAEDLVANYRPKRMASDHHLPRYLHAKTPGVAAARNHALDNAKGDVLLFIDDDEIAADHWPEGLIKSMISTGAALVGGPVDTEFIKPPPEWIVDGRFFDRPNPPDGAPQTWLRSGNLAIDLKQINQARLRFDESYAQGEDVNFSRRAAAAGLDLRWSRRGRIVEFVDEDRFTPEWRLKRERLATYGWARTELALDPSPRSFLAGALRATARTATGVSLYIGGVCSGNEITRIRGRSQVASARGRLDALRSHVGL